ncbi:MAG: site-specific integrase, partial [Bacillota bacterium]|nr:site-specific integrase [Bacillota bacterium]
IDKSLLKSDRGIRYQQHYDLGGGKGWSNSFSAASHRQLGWSHGAHGLRHSYAQQRMAELQRLGFFYDQALGLVSQTLGHFRPDITEVYLR